MPFSSPPLSSLKGNLGATLAVQWLRLRLPIQGLQVRSLAGELRSLMPHGQKTHKTQKQYCNKFNKYFKMVHIKVSLKKIKIKSP